MSPRPDDPLERSGRSDEPDDRSGRSDDRSSPARDAPHPSSGGGSTQATGGDDRQAPKSEQHPEPAVPRRQPTPVTQQVGRVVIVLLAVLFGVFAVDNSQSVDFAWVFGESQVTSGGTGGVPLIVLLVMAALIGAALGALIEWQFLRGRRARRADRESARRADRESARRADRESAKRDRG